MLFGKSVVGQDLVHGRLDQLGRLAEPHAAAARNDLAGLALGGDTVLLGMDGSEQQRHLAELLAGTWLKTLR
jgi:hypothetical protein